ncbi:hypothetical protein AMS68_003440 [Peltaster fructicola]|uniref:Aminotransferase class V domain-containing protein n=1 Tax=Peltaster fructicola TaxID=286661 RepID=A0A6H0XT78_9PEZI|nr:hypothetical protein AMS68_003440 [Peltaster fructicola]
MTFNVDDVRSHFPALGKKQIYFDNAGGSQVLREVSDAVVAYLNDSNVQLGASYPISAQSTALYTAGYEAVAKYINAAPNEVVLGPSTTQLFRNLSLTLFEHITPGSQIIISSLDHEANIASWVQLAKWRQAEVVWWTAKSRTNPQLDVDVLHGLLSEKTKLVACTHTSNILGTVNNIRAIADKVHSVPGAFLVVDAVAYAPHRAVDVKALGVDFYCFSWYKVYGPHIASLYASKQAQAQMTSLGHFFKKPDNLENIMGLAAASYELTAAVLKVCEYLQGVPWDQIAAYEEKLQGILIDYLNSKPEQIQIYGEPVADRTKRVPVVSFTVKGRSSKEVVDTIESRSNYGCRWGSFYSDRLVRDILQLDPTDGVIRVSLVHYNTEEEIRGLVSLLDSIIA